MNQPETPVLRQLLHSAQVELSWAEVKTRRKVQTAFSRGCRLRRVCALTWFAGGLAAGVLAMWIAA